MSHSTEKSLPSSRSSIVVAPFRFRIPSAYPYFSPVLFLPDAYAPNLVGHGYPHWVDRLRGPFYKPERGEDIEPSPYHFVLLSHRPFGNDLDSVFDLAHTLAASA